jgi:hypothetical protein
MTGIPCAPVAARPDAVPQRPHSGSFPQAVRDLHEIFVRNARAQGAAS